MCFNIHIMSKNAFKLRANKKSSILCLGGLGNQPLEAKPIEIGKWNFFPKLSIHVWEKSRNFSILSQKLTKWQLFKVGRSRKVPPPKKKNRVKRVTFDLFNCFSEQLLESFYRRMSLFVRWIILHFNMVFVRKKLNMQNCLKFPNFESRSFLP